MKFRHFAFLIETESTLLPISCILEHGEGSCDGIRKVLRKVLYLTGATAILSVMSLFDLKKIGP